MAEDSSTILYQHYNFDNVFNRSVIAGLLNLLNHELTYKQTFDDNVTETVTVPFAYNFAHAKDQRFAQDNYTFFGRECFSDKFIDGKFDMLPRFTMTYTGSQIDSNNITNRFVKGKYTKDEGGKITTYTAYLYSIPITMNFDLEGWIDNLETAFKIEESIRNTFYKNKTFNVLYRGMKIGCCVGFPENISGVEKTVSYSFEQENQLKMNFSLAVECYQPCFDESTAIDSELVIEHIGYDISMYNKVNTPLNKKIGVKLISPSSGDMLSCGQETDIKWDSSSNVSDVCTVILYYKTEDGDKHIIDCPLFNSGIYSWKVPYYASKFDQPDVVFVEDEISVVKNPSVNIIPNRSGEILTGSFDIIDAGEFSGTGLMQVSCESVESDGTLNIHDCYIANITENGIESIKYYTEYTDEQLAGISIINKEPFSYSIEGISNKISVGIAYPLDTSIFDEKSNILII